MSLACEQYVHIKPLYDFKFLFSTLTMAFYVIYCYIFLQIYWIGPIAGSLFGGVIYHFLYAQPSFAGDITYKPRYSRTSTQFRDREENETNL